MWSADASTLLWDEIKRVLNDCIFAESTLTDNEELMLAEAINFLTDIKTGIDRSKTPVYSNAVNKYYEYKKVYDSAEDNYINAKISAEASIKSSTGEEAEKLKQEWALKEKKLIDIKNKSLQDWKNLGFKEKVESSQATRNTLEPKKSLLSYKQDYLNDIIFSEISDLNSLGVGFYTTFFSPNDAFDTNLSWPVIDLTKDEINTLAQNAPAELKNVIDLSEGSDDIEGISLEYNDVVIIRPWAKFEFFASRYWKLPDSTIISDGNVPRNGKIPSFITSMIVIRNVKVTRKKTSGPKPFVLPLLSKVSLQTFDAAALQKPVIAISGKKLEASTPIHAKEMMVNREVQPPMASRSSFAAGDFRRASIEPTSRVALRREEPADDLINEKRMMYMRAKYEGTTIETPKLIRTPEVAVVSDVVIIGPADQSANNNWAPQQSVAGRTSTSPSLAVYNDKLYMAYKGISTKLWFRTFDGNSWAPEQNVAGIGTSNGHFISTIQR